MPAFSICSRLRLRDGLFRFRSIGRIGVRTFLLAHGVRFAAQRDVHREVVRPDVSKTPHIYKAKVIRVKDVIDRSAKAGIARVERAEEASAFPRLKQTAHFLE